MNSIKSGSDANLLDINNDKEALVALNQDPTKAGVAVMASENDDGLITLTRNVLSPETDQDYRLRISQELFLDEEILNYTAQNTGKHRYDTQTMTNTWGTGGMLTNATSTSTVNFGTKFSTYAFFPFLSSGSNLYAQGEISFSTQPVANTIIELGFFTSTSAISSVIDGAFFRLTSAGLFGVISHSGTETTTAVFTPFVYTTNQVYKFLVVVTDNITQFWIDDQLYGSIPTPVGQGQPFMSSALPFALRHYILGGTAGGVFQATLRGYTVSLGGVNLSRSLSELGNASFGSYQGLSGGTMGQLIAGTVTSGTLVKPTAAIPANTSLVANLPNNLGGRIYEQLTGGLAANVDAIFSSYTVPAGTVSIPGKRLKITGIKLSGMVSTVVVGGPAYTEWYIAFGHNADSLATTESNITKAPRRVMLPELTSNMGGAAAAGTLIVQPAYISIFPEPIYVNPGERVQLVGNKTITTAITSGVLSWTYQFIFSWE